MTEQDRKEFEAWLDYWWDTTEWSDDDKEEGFLAFKAARRTQSEQVRELVDILKRLRSHILPDAGQEGEDLLRMDLNDVDDLLAAQLKEQDDD